MKILLDCSLLSVGGGIQVGLSIIENMVYDPDFKTILICTPQIYDQLSRAILDKLEHYHVLPNVPFHEKTRQGKIIAELEKRYQPDLVFNVFGPSYWRSKQKNLQGFALGKMLYPEVRKSYPSKISAAKEALFDIVKQKLFFRNVDNFLVETPVVKQRLSDRFSISSEKIYVISNSYSPAFEQRLNSQKYIIRPNSENSVIFVPASFYYHKNLLILPQVLSILNQMNSRKIELKFTIEPNSLGWQHILKEGREYNVTEQLVTVGNIPNWQICDEYLSSSYVLCPSLVESSTAVFPESFIAQRPLLVSDRDFARNLCEDAALYFDPLDAHDMANRICELINNQNLQNSLLINAERILQKNYVTPQQKWQQQKQLLINLASED